MVRCPFSRRVIQNYEASYSIKLVQKIKSYFQESKQFPAKCVTLAGCGWHSTHAFSKHEKLYNGVVLTGKVFVQVPFHPYSDLGFNSSAFHDITCLKILLKNETAILLMICCCCCGYYRPSLLFFVLLLQETRNLFHIRKYLVVLTIPHYFIIFEPFRGMPRYKRRRSMTC